MLPQDKALEAEIFHSDSVKRCAECGAAFVPRSKQARAIETTLNAGRKKEEALAMLKKWFPQMENFSGQLKKYKVTINDLLEENRKLEARAKACENGKTKDTMERAKLESELHNIQRVLDRIPPDVLAELKRQQQYGKDR